MKSELWVFIVAISAIVITEATNTFETISDDDLVERIKSNEFVIALFCKWNVFIIWWDCNFHWPIFINCLILAKKNCVDCDRYENELFKVRDDLAGFPAEVVKIVDSQMVRLYNPTKEPAVVFFRHGVPLLYDGSINADEIYQKFDENKTPAVKELTDESFEHLTQAATGSTTGDWLVLLYISVSIVTNCAISINFVPFCR